MNQRSMQVMLALDQKEKVTFRLLIVADKFVGRGRLEASA